MRDDVRERWQAWLSGETFVHPDSPAGGGGCGASRPPASCGPQSYSSALHPDAPAVRYWLPQSPPAEQYDAAAAAAGAEEIAGTFAAKSAAFADALPDSALKAAFERHLAWLYSRRGLRPTIDNGRVDRETLMLRLREAVGWVAPNFSDMLPGSRVTKAASNGDDDAAERLIATAYDTAKASILEQWAEATRGGASRQGELVRTWSRNIERIMRRAHVMSGTEQAAPEIKRGRLADLVPISPSAAVRREKTWVEFQLLDDDDKPIPNAAFEVTLTDGSIMTGRLNSLGACRFENIDPGNCQIKFPELDAKEWKPA